MKKKAFVLGGGGAKGAYEIGIWKALRELEIEFSMVVGTSVGALNGALYAQGDYENAERLWSNIEPEQVFSLKDGSTVSEAAQRLSAAKTYLQNIHDHHNLGLDTTPLRELIAAHISEEAVRRSSIDFGLVTVMLDGSNTQVKEYFIHQIPQGQLHQYLIASSALFPALAYEVIDGKIHVDGGYYNNIPTNMALTQGVEETLSVDLDAVGITPEPKPQENQTCDLIRTSHDLGSVLDFSKEQARRNIRLGYLDAMKHYGQYQGRYFSFLPGVFGKLTFREQTVMVSLIRGVYQEEKGFWAPLHHEIKKYCPNRSPTAEILFQAAAEAAGVVFGIDDTIVYSEREWIENLREKAAAKPLRQDQSGISHKKSLRKFIESLDGPSVALFLCHQLEEATKGGSAARLRAVAVLKPKEFLAALFLWVAKILPKSLS